MSTEEATLLDATAQAELVRTGAASPGELIEQAIARIESVDPQLNAVITPMFDDARERARTGPAEGPFTGVPYLLKDFGEVEVAGVRFTEGSAFLADFVPDADSEIVRRLRRAGFVICGKTNTCEFGILPTTEPAVHGPTRNPWDTSRSPGGSSGGSAAAVAAGMVPAAHGNDAGGSIRIPASCCGLFGLKPTRGRNTLAPLFGEFAGGVAEGHALTVSVRDSAAVLDATGGPAPGDPTVAPAPARPFAQEVGTDPGRLRIGIATESPAGIPVHDSCRDAVTGTARLCEELGHHVTDITLPVDGERLMNAFIVVYCSATAWICRHWSRRTGREITASDVEPTTWTLRELGETQGSADYLEAWETLHALSRDLARLDDEFDLVLTPTMAEPPAGLGEFDATEDDPLQGLMRSTPFVAFTVIGNVTGRPAMSVPLHWDAEGMPIGTQAIGRFGDEATLFRLASQLEAAQPWAHRRPPVHAAS